MIWGGDGGIVEIVVEDFGAGGTGRWGRDGRGGVVVGVAEVVVVGEVSEVITEVEVVVVGGTEVVLEYCPTAVEAGWGRG